MSRTSFIYSFEISYSLLLFVLPSAWTTGSSRSTSVKEGRTLSHYGSSRWTSVKGGRTLSHCGSSRSTSAKGDRTLSRYGSSRSTSAKEGRTLNHCSETPELPLTGTTHTFRGPLPTISPSISSFTKLHRKDYYFSPRYLYPHCDTEVRT